tara:strand:- start:5367 stop:5780 length:414 start_codon:yes stop_codon:yes gene_type:complete
MQKGQVSFDLILTVIIALIFIGGMQVLNSQMQDSQKVAAVRGQERLIGLHLFHFVANASSLSDADDLEINYTTRKIIVPEESLRQECTVNLENEKIDYNLNGVDVIVDMVGLKTTGIESDVPNNVKCGEVLTISKSS